MFDKIIKVHQELEELNNNIIKKQDDHIKALEAHVLELRNIIQKYILKDVKL